MIKLGCKKLSRQLALAIILVGLLAIKLSIVGWLILDGDVLPNAVAADKAQEPKSEKTEDVIEKQKAEDAGREAAQESVVGAELAKKQMDMLEEERRIERERKQLEVLNQELSKKLEALSKVQAELQAMIGEKNAANEQKIKHLIKAYAAMTPKNAAALIEKLDMNIAIDVLSNMQGEAVGKILTYVAPEKAAMISQRLLKR
ncbi:MAG: hypothetical protein V1753_11815 [Pseudomonadota bacterium]